MGHSEVDFDFTVYYRFAESKYWLHKFLCSGIYSSGDPVFIEITRDFKSDGEQGDVVLRLKKSVYGQSEAARLWYKNLRDGLLECGFVMSKMDPCLFMSKTVICVVYVDDFLFCARSQSEIDNVMISKVQRIMG